MQALDAQKYYVERNQPSFFGGGSLFFMEFHSELKLIISKMSEVFVCAMSSRDKSSPALNSLSLEIKPSPRAHLDARPHKNPQY